MILIRFCLSYPGNVEYIVESMKEIAKIGFDGYTLEESESRDLVL